MSELRAKATRTLSRLKEGLTLTADDYALLIPVTENILNKLNQGTRIRFQHVSGGYVIGDTSITESLGLKYIQYLLQSSPLSCLHMTSGPPLPTGVASQEGKQAEAMAVIYYDDDHMEDIGQISRNTGSAANVFDAYDMTTNRPLGELMDGKYMRAVQHRINHLRDSGEASDELAYLEKYLTENTYRGRSKQHTNERERARQSVRKAIKSAIAKLIENPDTGDIGLHLQDNITFGCNCSYTGNWKWNY